ncbi:acyl-CoA dehydrogenase [Caldisphaera lagunensis DSM 15908]|uniref:Acyl-CoA dehydrogenase n=1 Tax=Caldisphaera lagunensis (strain DSM 15908 / JCM 11604 / ANMR 0165 / IC-154) TaxID=1056495 RepID=L0A7S4_CALLD|nr:acyl-CoA dehydrogenase family protein [Caldisphaera lagunensis]AFZ69923.1 acyl-CoA dehydrogenase [Caldisphaera lagunensis DSM 15908]
METKSDIDLLRSSVREFSEKVLMPVAKKIDAENFISEDILNQVANMGYFALRVPDKYGGPNLSTLESAIVVEELARASGAVAVISGISGTMVAYPLVHYASEELKEEYLGRLSKGKIGAFALSEPCCGSDAANITTKAEIDGNDYVINGRKTWITNSTYADFFLVAARTGKQEDRHKGITIFVVDNKDCIEKSKLDMMGVRGSGTSELLFKDCRVPKENIVGEVNNGFKIIIDGINEGRVVTAAIGLGIMQAAFDESLNYAKIRETMGKPIIEHEMVQSMIADMKVKLEASRLLIYNAAQKIDNNEIDYPMWSSIAKYATAKWGVDVVRLAMQVEGGFGYSKESNVERYYRDIKGIEIGDGTNEIQKLVISRSLAGKITSVRK